ncbi:phage tail tape measure protein [Roseibium aggregatum]|uniref:phage tail tape measure protein n=1 Tax=Roseibium aggregatum TaxID=187304 RepID=UPI001A8DE9BC|nr:phage tail tape measure protein [Roseibium aggregatum]MBN8181033.1 phage tail tape measure protein [Roseibium aggregatum]
MATLTSQLIVSLVERVSRPARAVSQSLTEMRLRVDANARAMDAMRGRMLDAVGVGYVLAKAISAPINAAREFESVMADVNKVVDFDTPDGLKQMSADILALSRVIPVAATGIAEIVAAAGQAGMQGDELLAFAEIAAKVGVAFDLSADQAGESLAKIKTALGLTVEQTGELADVLNHLSNTSASSAADLLDFMRRVGSAGTAMGFSAREVAAIGSAMVAAGAQADVAATSFRNVTKALARGESASKRQHEAYKKLGLSATDVAQRLQKDAVGTLQDVIARIRALPKELQASTISDLFGDEARAVMPLIENAELLQNALGQVASETNYLGSAQKEFEVRSQTFNAKLQSFQNRMTELAIAIGNALLPALTAIIEAVMPTISAIADLAAAYPQVTAAVVGVTAALVALNIAAIASRYSFLFLKGGVLNAALVIGRSADLIIAATKRLRLAVLGASMLGALGGGTFFGVLAGAAGAAVGAIQAAAAAIGAAIAGVTWPIALVIAAVAALGAAVYRYWEPIREFTLGFAEVIGSSLGQAMSAITGFMSSLAAHVGQWATKKLVDIGSLLGIDEAEIRGALDKAYGAISSTLGKIVDVVLAIPAQLGNWIADIFTMKDYSATAEAEFRDAGRKIGQALVDAIIDAFSALWEFLKSIPDRIVAAIGRIDLSNMLRLPSFLSGGGGEAPAAPQPKIEGARALGGPVVAGRTYRTAEKGDELFTPDRNGFIHSAAATKRILAGAGQWQAGGQSVSLSIGDIHVHGAQDAKAVAEKIGEEIRSQLAGLQADTGWSVV